MYCVRLCFGRYLGGSTKGEPDAQASEDASCLACASGSQHGVHHFFGKLNAKRKPRLL